MKAAQVACMLVLCSVEARFLKVGGALGDSLDTELKSIAELQDQVDDEYGDDDDDDVDKADTEEYGVAAVSTGDSLDNELKSVAELEDRVKEEYGDDGDGGEADTGENGAAVVSTESVQAPVGLVDAGLWNRTHSTLIVSDTGFKCPYNNDHDYDSDDDHPEVNVRCAEWESLVKYVQDAEQKLMNNLHEQTHVVTRLRELDNEDPEIVKKHAAAVAKETDSPALGSFLGNWWREMRVFAHPWYSSRLADKQNGLEAEELKLQVALKESNRAVASLRKKYAAEDEAQQSLHKDGEDKIDASVHVAEANDD